MLRRSLRQIAKAVATRKLGENEWVGAVAADISVDRVDEVLNASASGRRGG